jgi:hypothetical protein
VQQGHGDKSADRRRRCLPPGFAARFRFSSTSGASHNIASQPPTGSPRQIPEYALAFLHNRVVDVDDVFCSDPIHVHHSEPSESIHTVSLLFAILYRYI